MQSRSTGATSGSHGPGWVLALTSTAFFMTALDALVVVIALPAIEADLHVGLATLQWTVNSYNIALAGGIVVGAALGDRFGRRKVFVVGLVVFGAASAACSLAPNIGLLIAARTVQGLGGAIILPLSLTILVGAVRSERRAAVVGIYGGLAGLAVASGPILGGAVTEALDWHWIFWLNVPVGMAAGLLSLRFLPESHGSRVRIDLGGVALVTAAVVGLVWALTRGNDDGWTAPGTILGLVLGGIGLVGFLIWEDHAPAPMMPLRLLRNRGFSAGNLAAFLSWGSISAGSFLATQHFQFALGYAPLEAGVRLLPFFATPMLVAPLAGWVSHRVGVRRLVVIGLLLQGAGFGWLAIIASRDASYPLMTVALLIAGVGVSMTLPTIPTAVLATVEPVEMGIASGVINTMQRFGAVLGIAVATGVFSAYGNLGSAIAVTSGFGPAVAAVPAGFALLGALSAAFITARHPAVTEVEVDAAEAEAEAAVA